MVPAQPRYPIGRTDPAGLVIKRWRWVLKIVGLDHVQLAMPPGEEARARRFYGEWLGLDEIPKPEPLASRGGCWFGGGGVFVHLGVQKDFLPAQNAHPAFLVENLEKLFLHLDAMGVSVKVDATVPGVRRFYARDPFGNRIEFIQNGDGFSQS